MKKEEKIYLNKVAELGCVICKMPSEIHHIRTGQGHKRASNYDVIPLCPKHHRNGGLGIAIHAGIRTWEAKFGNELDFLKQIKEKLNNYET